MKKNKPEDIGSVTHPQFLTHKQLEMHGCIICSVATAALVLKHQVIGSHSADNILIYWTSSVTKYHICDEKN